MKGDHTMDNVTLIELLAQAEDSEAGAAVESYLRMAARTAFTTVLFQEVESLCGKAYQPAADSDYQRAGSAPGRYFFGTDEESVRRPRVRKNGKEVRLKTYEAAQSREALPDAMLRAFMAGMPSRDVQGRIRHQ